MAKLNEEKLQKYEKVALSENGKVSEKNDGPKPYGYGVRHVQAFIIFMSLTVTFISRAHLSVTIVAMTDGAVPNLLVNDIETNAKNIIVNAVSVDENNTDSTFNTTNKEIVNNDISTRPNYTCINGSYILYIENIDTENIGNNSLCDGIDDDSDINDGKDQNGTVKESNVTIQNAGNSWSVYRTYAWPKSTQEMVLGSFFLGYLIMTTPMGLVAQRWGGKLPLQISLFASGILTFVTPWLAVWGGYKAVSIVRVMTGLVQAGTYPCIHTLIAKWVPSCERGRLATYVYTGTMIGSILAFHVSGFLAASVMGWPSIYWVAGVLCLIMATFLTLFVSPTPQQHKNISEEEKEFILDGFAEITMRQPTPWKAIFTSQHVWAVFVTHLGTGLIFYFLFTQVPSYLHFVVGLNIKSSGLLSSLPYLANFFFSIGIGNLSDYCINKKIVGVKTVRIISNTIANVGPALCLYAVSFTTNPTLAVALLVICLGTHGACHTGWTVNYIDLAPNFSGILMATGNNLMNMGALILPMFVSFIVTDVTNALQWRIVMFAVATLAVTCHIVFAIFMSADVQPWNYPNYETTDQEDPEAKNGKKPKNHIKQ